MDPFLERLAGDEALDAALRELARTRRRGLGDHPAADELVDCLLGALPPAAEERIQEHLALCRECAGLALDLAALSAPLPARGLLPPGEQEREWERFARRLAPRRSRSTPRPRLSRRRFLALAASLLIGVGLGLSSDRLFRGDRERPRADVVLVDLAPLGAGARRSAEAPKTLRLPPRAGRLALLLNLGDLRRFPRYEMDLVAPGGRIAWREGDALRSEDGTFVLDLPARTLAGPGLYHIRIRGRQGAARTPPTALADYAVEVLPRR